MACGGPACLAKGDDSPTRIGKSEAANSTHRLSGHDTTWCTCDVALRSHLIASGPQMTTRWSRPATQVDTLSGPVRWAARPYRIPRPLAGTRQDATRRPRFSKGHLRQRSADTARRRGRRGIGPPPSIITERWALQNAKAARNGNKAARRFLGRVIQSVASGHRSVAYHPRILSRTVGSVFAMIVRSSSIL